MCVHLCVKRMHEVHTWLDKLIRKLDFIEVSTQAASLILEFGIQLHLKCIWNWDLSQIQIFRWNLGPSVYTWLEFCSSCLSFSAQCTQLDKNPKSKHLQNSSTNILWHLFNMLSFKSSLLNYQITFPFQTHFIFIKSASKCFLMTTDQKIFI